MTNQEKILEFIKPIMNKAHKDDLFYRALIDSALKNIDSGTAKVIGVSGKKAAGKDTFYDEYVAEIDSNAKKAPTSAAIREEASYIIGYLYEALEKEPREDPENYWNAVNEGYEKWFSIDKHQASRITDSLLPVLRSRKGVTGFDRDNEITTALQILGNEAHGEQDELYWARKMALNVLANAAVGKTSIVPDVRYERDADAVRLIHGKIVRLEISPEVQRERLMSRDGLVVPEKTLGHISETALDNYKKFDIIINSNNMSPKEVIHVVEASWK